MWRLAAGGTCVPLAHNYAFAPAANKQVDFAQALVASQLLAPAQRLRELSSNGEEVPKERLKGLLLQVCRDCCLSYLPFGLLCACAAKKWDCLLVAGMPLARAAAAAAAPGLNNLDPSAAAAATAGVSTAAVAAAAAGSEPSKGPASRPA